MSISTLSQDPNLVTQTILLNIVLLLNTTDSSMPQGLPMPTWDGPSISIIWAQRFLYLSLVCSLLVALGAVLATQRLSRYRAVDERGTVEDRGKRRQQKFDGLQAWGFRVFLETLPILLQFSLLLFGISICAYMWSQQRVIAGVLIFTNALGALLWLYTVVVSAIYPESPYDTPISNLLASKKKTTNDTSIPPSNDVSSFADTSSTHTSSTTTSHARFSTPPSRASKFIAKLSTPLLDSVNTWWQHIQHRRSDVEQAHSEESMNISPRYRAVPSAIQIYIVGPIRTSAVAAYQWFSRPISCVLEATSRIYLTILSLLSELTSPIVEAHTKRLARSCPTTNDVRISAFSWLLEVSTDPEVHVHAFLMVPEMDWTDEIITQSFPSERLDFMLERLGACFQSDCYPKADSIDRLVSLCATFLSVYWHLYRVSLKSTHVWSVRSGRAFLRSHRGIVDVLKNMDLKAHSFPAEDNWILYHAYLTFMHFDETRGARKLISIVIPGMPARNATEPAPQSSTLTVLSRLRILSLIYLTQLSWVDYWDPEHYASLFAQIEGYHNQGAVDAPYFSLYAMAMLLGLRTDTIGTLEYPANVGWPEAVMYILDKIAHYLRWKAQEEEAELRTVRIFSMWDEENYPGTRTSKIPFTILQILHSAVGKLPSNHDAPSSHFDWLTAYLPRICGSNEETLELIFQCVINAIVSLSHTVNTPSRANGDSLHAAFSAVAQLKLPLENHQQSPLPSAFCAFVRMQYTVLSFIHTIHTSPDKENHPPDTNVPTFSFDFSDWDLSQPRMVLSAMSEEERDLITKRDHTFMDILLLTTVGSSGMAARRVWFSDSRNDHLVRQWIYVTHRWKIPYQEELPGNKDPFSVTLLFDCEKVRQPEESHWGEDLVHAQQVLVIVLCRTWYQRLNIANDDYRHLVNYSEDSDGGTNDNYQTDFGELVESTLFVLNMDTRHALLVERYIKKIRSYFVGEFSPLIRKLGSSRSPLSAVRVALEAKVDEIEKMQFNGADHLTDQGKIVSETGDSDGAEDTGRFDEDQEVV
ncbi:hypothetical protein BXZ70DRAFT_903609 [Cristinia sonorae]|uniref:DUF6535 domain-containing protein n=1 Tax=Cristinia sonorae TaxID=1940300 RepID=A0A8K0XUC0_9AGAR|nr:hypothetical protein BXZ70DRAFT_903609 [Cristinia sonorae]